MNLGTSEWPFTIKHDSNLKNDSETWEGNDRKITIYRISKMSDQDKLDAIVMVLKFLKRQKP